MLKDLRVPRWFFNDDTIRGDLSVHVFSDASKDAFAACVFIRCERDRKVSVQLVQAKSRVAPLKNKGTIPRLELLGALIASRLYHSVMASLKLDTCQVKSYCWTDSTVVLYWLRDKSEYKPFVSNRVTEINELTRVVEWRYCGTNENPCDLLSRGCSVDQLLKSEWWNGPEWLYAREQDWPLQNFLVNEDEAEKEKKKGSLVLVDVIDENESVLDCLSDDDFTDAVCSVAWVLRFFELVRKKNVKGELTCDELQRAEFVIWRLVQKNTITSDYKEKHLNNFVLYEDEFGVLRLKTKIIQNEDLDKTFTEPILLPEHELVKSMIKKEHFSNHCGVQTTLCRLRERYWIISGRRLVKKVINKCMLCKRYNARPVKVITAPLPKNRVELVAAFQVTGVDLFGPLFLKNGEKCWGAIFTCAVYRAVHLELLMSLSTDCFILALRRFISRRGKVSVIQSDNGTNFTGCRNLLKSIDWSKVRRDEKLVNITWKLNVPLAPWWGGYWERLIGLVKNLLRKNLGKAALTYEELLTMFCDCESYVNSRPLTYISDDPRDTNPLTPTHFLNDIQTCSTFDLDLINSISFKKRVRYVHEVRQHLKQRFKCEYLSSLSYYKNNRCGGAITVGDIVLIGADDVKRLDWPLGKVIEIFTGRDGVVRSVKLRTAKGEVTRPVQKLYWLEAGNDETTVNRSNDNEEAMRTRSGKIFNTMIKN